MKKHLSLILRLVVAVAGLGYIGWVLNWSDKVEVPAGKYTLSNAHVVEVDKPTAYRIISGDFDPVKPVGLLTIQVEPAPQTVGTLTIDASTQLGSEPNKDFRLRPGLLTTLRHANLWLLLLGLALVAPIYPITAARWWLLLRARELQVPLWNSFRLSLVGCFFNYCMPGSTGGDLVKAYYAAKGTDRRADAIMTVVIDRIVGLLGLVLLAGIAGLFILDNSQAFKATVFVWAIIGGIALGSAIYFSKRIRKASGLDWLLTKLLPPDSLLSKIDQAAVAYSNHKFVVFSSILLSLPVHLLLAISAAMAGYALGMTTPLGFLLTVVPLLFLVAAVPISYQGFGFMEVLALKLLNHPPFANTNQIVVMLVLIRLFQVFYSLFGSIFLLKGDIHMHPEQDDDQQASFTQSTQQQSQPQQQKNLCGTNAN